MKCGLYYYGQLADRTTHDIKSFIFVPFLCCFVLTDAITSGRTIQCLSGDQLAEMLTFIFFQAGLADCGAILEKKGVDGLVGPVLQNFSLSENEFGIILR